MFSFDRRNIAEMMADSHNYKIVQSGPMVYVFAAETNFEYLVAHDDLTSWVKKAVLVIDGEGRVLTNRFGAATNTDDNKASAGKYEEW